MQTPTSQLMNPLRGGELSKQGDLTKFFPPLKKMHEHFERVRKIRREMKVEDKRKQKKLTEFESFEFNGCKDCSPSIEQFGNDPVVEQLAISGNVIMDMKRFKGNKVLKDLKRMKG